MVTVYRKTKGLQDNALHYCPGCSHGIVHKLIGEVMEELDIIDSTIAVCPVGCAVFAGNYFACDTIEAAHGRAPAVATGIKRANPDRAVLHIRGMGILRRLALLKSYMPLCGGKSLPRFSSTTQSMA